MDTLPKVGFMPIRELFNQLSKRLGGIGGANTPGSDEEEATDEEGSTEAPTAADLDAAVAKAETPPGEGEATGNPGGLDDLAGTRDTDTDGRGGTATSVAGGTVLAEAGQPAGDRPDSEASAGDRPDSEASARSDAGGKGGMEGDELDSGAGTTAADGVQAGEMDASGQPEGDTGGPVQCRIDGCGQTFATAHGMKIHATKVHGEDVKPPHRDPERLREVYEAHDTFTEMTEALDVEVTPQTVRRSMAALGIHNPDDPDERSAEEGESTTDQAAGDASVAESADSAAGSQGIPDPEAGSGGQEADGADSGGDGPDPRVSAGDSGGAPETSLEECERLQKALPDGVEALELIAAIEEARTLYEVQRALGTDRTETHALLADLDLLDLVQCRLATKPDPEERRAELERRLGTEVDV